MTRSEIVAILRFLEETRRPAQQTLGINAPDPIWQMVTALLSRHYDGNSITISALAESALVPYATALRAISQMEAEGLVRRRRKKGNRKLVLIEPTDLLIERFLEYAKQVKVQIGTLFGMGDARSDQFMLGTSHLVARIIPAPARISRPLGLSAPLRLLLKDESSFLSLVRIMSEVEVLLGCELSVEMLDYYQLLETVLQNARREVSSYDVIAFDAPWLGQLAALRALRPLDRELRAAKFNVFDFYASAWEGGQYRGELLGIPFAPTAELLLYRRDLFERHGLEPPRTVEDVLVAAEALHQPQQNQYGISWNAARGQPLGQTFIQVMGAFGGPPINLRRAGENYVTTDIAEDILPQVNSAEGLAAAEYLQALAAWSPPGIATMDWNSKIAAFRNGQTAMSYEWSSRAAIFEWDSLSPARGKTGYLPHPRGGAGNNISPIGGYFIGIPANLAPERVEPVWRALMWLCSPEVCKHLILNASPVNVRYSVCADPEVQNANPVLRVVDAMSRLGQLQQWQRPSIPQITDFMTVLGEELHGAVFGRTNLRAALSRAESRLVNLLR